MLIKAQVEWNDNASLKGGDIQSSVPLCAAPQGKKGFQESSPKSAEGSNTTQKVREAGPALLC